MSRKFQGHIALSMLLAFIVIGCSPRSNPKSLADRQLKELQNQINIEKQKANPDQKRIEDLENKLHVKRKANSLSVQNMQVLKSSMSENTELYSLKGVYKVLVIPVEFSDVAFTKPDFFKADNTGNVPAQDYLFGEQRGSLTAYYRHASLGQLDVKGEVVPTVKMTKPLAYYGEATSRDNDIRARELTKEALLALRNIQKNDDWWEQYDQWDLADYDNDGHHNEPDGFIDAVILVYAGKEQSSCQRIFDPKGERPASRDVPAGPRQAATVECFNRIWPHRWSLSIHPKDPVASQTGPIVEGIERPTFNGLKITDKLFALDYNMQSEFSDRSTFMHEFGHSLTLPDVYASSGDNSTGLWELMSSNADNEGQELSSYSKLSLGWILPKIIKPGENTSFYLGSYNYVSANQRNPYSDFTGPTEISERTNDGENRFTIVSQIPGLGESVYRSAIALTEPSIEKEDIAEFQATNGRRAAYSGRYDNDSRSIKLKLAVPEAGDATLKFDLWWHIETETNFDSTSASDKEIKITTSYDVAEIFIDRQLKETLELLSGDNDKDSLVESSEFCEAERVKELRLLLINKTITDDEKKELESKVESCRVPVWKTYSYDLSSLRGKTVTLEIRYTTDAGYTEAGVLLDNVRLGSELVDFEQDKDRRVVTEFKYVTDGKADVEHHQFYLFEYRDPSEAFTSKSGFDSYNMDNNINSGIPVQSMFLDEPEKTPLQRLRMVKTKYQPGVLVWYYNSRFSRVENSPSELEGKGYLLVLNSKVKELVLPAPFDSKKLLNKDGHYMTESGSELDQLITRQRDEFVCFGYTKYATYINGEAPKCDGYSSIDQMLGLKWDGKSLLYRRELINDVHPTDSDQFVGVEVPFRNSAGIRSGLSTFNPAQNAPFQPFEVFEWTNGNFVQAQSATQAYAPVSRFNDSNNSWSEAKRFQEDSVVVEKQGFGFEVVAPDTRILKRYLSDVDADKNENTHRRPRAKLIIKWE